MLLLYLKQGSVRKGSWDVLGKYLRQPAKHDPSV